MGSPSHRPSWSRLCLGLPGLLFLAWAWIYSNHQTSDLEYRPWGLEASSCHGHLLLAQLSSSASTTYRVDRWTGVVYSTKEPEPLPSLDGEGLKWTEGFTISCDFGAATLPPDFSFYGSEVHPAQRTWWPPPRFQSSDDPKEEFWLLTLPYWALIAGYLAAWTGLWIRTVRRRKRLLTIAGETSIPLKPPPAPTNY